MVGDSRRGGARGLGRIQGSVVKVLRSHPGFRLLKSELGIWADLARAFRGISVVAEGEIAIPAKRGLWFVPGMVTAATVVEIVAIELLLPWPAVRIALAVGSAYSLLILWGIFAQRAVHVHTVGTRLTLRRGRTIIAAIDVAEVSSVALVRDYSAEQHALTDGVLELTNGQGSNVRIVLNDDGETAVARPPTWSPWRPKPAQALTEVRMWADDPEAAISVIRTAAAR